MLRHFHFWCQRVVPLVYDNSLSYYEVLCKVADKLNEVISQVNNQQSQLETDINELFNQFENEITTNITNLINTSISDLDTKFGDMIAKQNADVNRLIQEVQLQWTANLQAQNCQIKNAIAAMELYVTKQVNSLFSIIDTNDDYIKNWVQIQLDKFMQELPGWTTVYVTAPYSGETVTLQECLNELWDLLRYGSLTCLEYDTAYLTCGEYDALKLTCGQYDLYGRFHIYPHKEWHNMHSPYTGEWVPFAQVIGQLAAYHRTGGLTAEEYDNLNLSATNYDDKNITAYHYDWTAKSILTEVTT